MATLVQAEQDGAMLPGATQPGAAATAEPVQPGGSLTARTAWLMLARTVAFTFSFALPLLLVRRLDQTEFGLYKQVFLVVTTGMYVLPLGFHMSAFYFLPRERERQGEIVFNLLLFPTVVTGLACLLLLLWPGLLATIFHGPELVPYASLIGLVILLWGASASLEYIAIANQEALLANVFIIVSQLSRTAFLLGAALVAGTVRALIWAALVQGVLQCALLLWYTQRRFAAVTAGLDWPLLRQQLAYAVPLGFAAIFVRFQLDVDNYFVSHRYDAAAFAIYAVGCFNVPLFSLLGDAIGSVMIPRVAYLQKLGARHDITVLTARMVRKLAALALPSYAFLLLLGPEFIAFLFTPKYAASWPIFAVNLAQIPLGIIFSASDPVMRAYAEYRYFLLKVRATLFGLLLLLLWYVVGRFGLVGAVASVVCVTALERLIMVLALRHILGWTWHDLTLFKDVGKLALATLAAVVVTVPLHALVAGTRPFVALTVCGVVFTLVYLAGVLLLRVPEPEERASVRQKITRLARVLRLEPKGAA